MKRKKISEVLNNLDEDVIKEAVAYEKQPASHRPRIIKIAAVCAACLVLITSAAFVIFKLQSEKTYITYIGGVEREYKKDGKTSFVENVAWVWPWEYLEVYNQYPNLIFDGKEYHKYGNIDKAYVGESLGVVEAFGFDQTDNDKEYRKSFEIFSVNSINNDFLIAVYIEDRYILFKDDDYTPPATLGELLNDYNLSENIELKLFEKYTNYKGDKGTNYYTTDNGDAVWKLLAKSADIPCVTEDIDLWLKGERKFISFTLTSDALGVYKQVMYITSDGYLSTNIFGPAYVYYIGEAAAKEIADCAKQNAAKAEKQQYNESITGYVTAIEKDYVLVDDSAFCKNVEDGMVFKITLSEKKLKGYVEVEGLNVGDLVCVEFFGKIDTDNGNLITDVYNINQARLIKDPENEIWY